MYLYYIDLAICPKNHLPRLRPDFPPARRVAGIRWTATKPGAAGDSLGFSIGKC